MKRRPTRCRSGFALVLTVTLLAFLAVLVVALVSVTRLETAIASNAQRQAQARQHALIALDLALGQLQLHAGPDRRATTTAASFDAIDGSRYFTGVWDSMNGSREPLTWLVSGNEGADPRAVQPDENAGAVVELVGVRTVGEDRSARVSAPKRPLSASIVPGQSGDVLTGHYAWWIGDQGVKAPVALPDRSAAIRYAPYDRAEPQRRLWQHAAFGVGASEFEVREAPNNAFVEEIVAFDQLAFLKRPDGAAVGPETLRRNFHAWSNNNLAVLANASAGGLRRDLSLAPALLGEAFEAWASSRSYTEDPAVPAAPAPSPAYSDDPLRRRCFMTPPTVAEGFAHGIAPVLSYCVMSFNVRTDQSVSGATRPIEVRARWMLSLWNPYSSALVPEDLRLEVEGLPEARFVNDTAGGVTAATFSLADAFGGPLRIALPWQPAERADQHSWLPGRVYSWTSLPSVDRSAPVPAAGFASQFYVRNFNVAGQGVQRLASLALVSNSAQCHVAVDSPSQLTLRLYRVAANEERQLLATFVGPRFRPFETTPATASAGTYQFSYVFRFAESIDTVLAPETWLTTRGRDPRDSVLPPESFAFGANGDRPELYPNYSNSSFPDRLLDRSLPASSSTTTGQSYNEDAPLFDLPRGPLLSVGALQHLRVVGERPFCIGNSWGAAGGWNALFDRYFFSGASAELNLAALHASDPLPNASLQPQARRTDGTGLTAAGVAAGSADGYSSRFLRQGGAFNINSVEREAWLAILRAGRTTAERTFTYLDARAATGTNDDAATLAAAQADATFFRFSFSAQETFKADAGYAASTTTPPAAPNVGSLANTHLFRRGQRSLSTSEVSRLADAIVARVRQKHAASGPFRSLEDFLDSSALFAGHSLLEAAIAEAGLNESIDEFSSQWLTQGDVMAALAPVMFTRSDTFLIRTYGDVVNPVTGVLEGRAWAEAWVQREPDYVDPVQSAETEPEALNARNARFGRQFKIVSFRWLTVSDI